MREDHRVGQRYPSVMGYLSSMPLSGLYLSTAPGSASAKLEVKKGVLSLLSSTQPSLPHHGSPCTRW